MQPVYNRIILKISGEALSGEQGFGINAAMVRRVAGQIIRVAQLGVQIGIVVGAGNIWRGRSGGSMDRATADYMGMLATAINSLALQDALEQQGMQTRVQSAIEMRQIAEPYVRRRAIRHMEKGRVVIFACGSGNPFFSTDTAAALRAAEIDADAILLAKNIDGVYSADPRTTPDAEKITEITHLDVINRGLAVMDNTALTLCRDNGIPILVFALDGEENIVRVVCGEKIGTYVGDAVGGNSGSAQVQ